MSLPKLKIPPEFCYYAFNDKEPEQIPNLWRHVQSDRKFIEEISPVDVPLELKMLIQGIEQRSLSKAEALEQMHIVFGNALLQGYEKMEDLVENSGASDRVEEIRNMLIPFLPPKMKPFVPDHHRISIRPSQRLCGGGRRRQP